MARERFGFVVIDNASDAFAGDEINRAAVRAFVRSLAAIARSVGGAVLLLAHVDKGTARAVSQAGAESYSGSTAWNNSVRSRLFLLETARGELELRHEKCNLAAKAPPLRLEWPQDGVIEVPQTGGIVAAIEGKTQTRAVLAMLHEFATRGESIATAATSPNNAARLLSREPGFPKGLKPAAIAALLRDAERSGLIVRESYQNAARHHRERWTLTRKGAGLIGAAPTASTAPPSKDDAPDSGSAEGAPTAPTSMQGVWGVCVRAEDGAGSEK